MLGGAPTTTTTTSISTSTSTTTTTTTAATVLSPYTTVTKAPLSFSVDQENPCCWREYGRDCSQHYQRHHVYDCGGFILLHSLMLSCCLVAMQKSLSTIAKTTTPLFCVLDKKPQLRWQENCNAEHNPQKEEFKRFTGAGALPPTVWDAALCGSRGAEGRRASWLQRAMGRSRGLQVTVARIGRTCQF